MSWLASKGVLEDLTPYLESSGTVNKDDLLESVLNAFTYSDKLVSIPAAFSLQTVIGSGADLGDREGWSVEDMIAYADAHPDAQLFNYSSKENILQMCMMFGEDAFVNWESGECKFDTPEFKAILEFVNRFPDEFQYEDGQASAPTRLQNGEILLDTCGIYDFGEVQMYEEIFKGDYTCIGYPTVDGSSGTVLNVSSDMAITTKSDHKDGAWSFIESYLTADEPNPGWSFPNSKERLQKMAEEAVKVEYATDENGDILTDENGEPILSGGSSSVMYEDGWSYEYRQPTQEEVDLILGLIDKAKPANVGGDDEISKIISEEAAAYWQGQKSVDEVAKIIQNRIQTYVDENR